MWELARFGQTSINFKDMRNCQCMSTEQVVLTLAMWKHEGAKRKWFTKRKNMWELPNNLSPVWNMFVQCQQIWSSGLHSGDSESWGFNPRSYRPVGSMICYQRHEVITQQGNGPLLLFGNYYTRHVTHMFRQNPEQSSCLVRSKSKGRHGIQAFAPHS